MKRTCNGCKALEENFNRIGCRCTLNHPIECNKEIYGLKVGYIPMEECEKPMTLREYSNCVIEQHKISNVSKL